MNLPIKKSSYFFFLYNLVCFFVLFLLVSVSLSAQESYTETVNGVSFEMIWVEGGSFMMGYEPERDGKNVDVWMERWCTPLRKITLPGFYLAEIEVTQSLWRTITGGEPPIDDCGFNKNCDECPVETVTWEEVVNDFLPKLNQLTGKNYSLPTEAQWEYAARGGQQSKGYKYAGSNDIKEVGWCVENRQRDAAHPVKTKKPNELGLYDITGNVWEWCLDDWHDSLDGWKTNYIGIPQDGSAWIDKPRADRRVLRGGAWNNGAAIGCLITFRYHFIPNGRGKGEGFRLALQFEEH